MKFCPIEVLIFAPETTIIQVFRKLLDKETRTTTPKGLHAGSPELQTPVKQNEIELKFCPIGVLIFAPETTIIQVFRKLLDKETRTTTPKGLHAGSPELQIPVKQNEIELKFCPIGVLIFAPETAIIQVFRKLLDKETRTTTPKGLHVGSPELQTPGK